MVKMWYVRFFFFFAIKQRCNIGMLGPSVRQSERKSHGNSHQGKTRQPSQDQKEKEKHHEYINIINKRPSFAFRAIHSYLMFDSCLHTYVHTCTCTASECHSRVRVGVSLSYRVFTYDRGHWIHVHICTRRPALASSCTALVVLHHLYSGSLSCNKSIFEQTQSRIAAFSTSQPLARGFTIHVRWYICTVLTSRHCKIAGRTNALRSTWITPEGRAHDLDITRHSYTQTTDRQQKQFKMCEIVKSIDE
jgi:hypothetical protein